MSTTPDLTARESDLNAAIQRGEIMAAFEKHYDDDVVMRENADAPFVGKAVNRQREQAFVDSLREVHAVTLIGGAVGDDLTYSEWLFDVTFKAGQRAAMHQVAARRWKNGKVISERFYYNKG